MKTASLSCLKLAKTGNCLKIQVTAQHRFQLKICIKQNYFAKEIWVASLCVTKGGKKKRKKRGVFQLARSIMHVLCFLKNIFKKGPSSTQKY
jgi:hypothetical protein